VRAVKQQQLDEPSSSSPLALIRPADTDDVPICVSLAEGTQVFSPSEIHGLEEDLAACLRGDYRDDRLLSGVLSGRVTGFVHYGPSDIGEGTWYLYWIAVARETHGMGLGLSLLRRVEEEVKEQGGRLLLIETSSLPRYEGTRRFYLRNGYRKDCVIHDFYSNGDHKVVFSKKL
jgi:ribosomal protein S18 acetylase RimI-like enzyme